MRTETTTRPLRELVRGFHSGAILLPQFQRDFVWKSAKIRNLLDSLLKGFPIGGFYLWRPAAGKRDPKPKAHGEQRIAAEFVGYLIDGQQRLTSLEAAFGLYSGEDKGGTALRCYLDLAAREVEGARDTRLGGALLLRAAARCIRVAEEIGGVGLLIDAKNERAAQWYAGYGALALLDAPLSLVLPLAVAADALKRGGTAT